MRGNLRALLFFMRGLYARPLCAAFMRGLYARPLCAAFMRGLRPHPGKNVYTPSTYNIERSNPKIDLSWL
jgi:hypothetical protein